MLHVNETNRLVEWLGISQTRLSHCYRWAVLGGTSQVLEGMLARRSERSVQEETLENDNSSPKSFVEMSSRERRGKGGVAVFATPLFFSSS
jgi:hypothetical protein